MKVKATMKVLNNYTYVYRCSYCDLQNLFKLIEPKYYNTGVYGWNCDIYCFGDIAITTGYRNLKGKRIPDNLIKEYNELAKLLFEQRLSYNELKTELNIYIMNFIQKLLAL